MTWAEKHLEVIVDDSQLSLAIGKKGQNVRLAAKLLVWHIDIKSEEEKRQEIESQMAAMALRGAPISELQGLGDKTLGKLREHGIESVEQLAQMTPEDLMQIPGVGEKTVERIRRVVTDYFERDQKGTDAAAEGAESASEVEEGEAAELPEPVEPVETRETPPSEAAPSEPASEETAAPEQSAEVIQSAEPDTAEADTPAADHDNTEASGEGEALPDPGTPEAGGEEK